MRRRSLGLLLAASALFGAPAWAGGFAVADQDAAASGRSGAALARVGSASSIHFNPAGLAGLRGASAMVGVTAAAPAAIAADPAGGQSEGRSAIRTPPHLYAAYGLDRLALGAGFNAPFGGGLTWPEDWRGRYELVELKLEVLAGHLAAGYRVNRQLSIGAAVSLYRASVLLDKRLDFVDRDGRALLGGSGMGLGAGAGLSFEPNERLRFGVSGRIPATLVLTGRAHFEDLPPSFFDMLPDQSISTGLTLPGKVGIGVEVQLEPVRLFADLEYTFWSSFRSFAVDFSEAQTPDVSQPRNWVNTATLRLAAEKDFGQTTARAGAMIDGAASPPDTLSPSLPDSTRLGVSLGAGHRFGSVQGDLAYQFVTFIPRASEGDALPAQYSAWAHLLALSVSFGPKGAAGPSVTHRGP